MAVIAAAKPAPVKAHSAAPPASRLDGRLEAIDKGRLYGWVWNADQPDERLAISVLLDAKEIARAIADRPRIDLRRNGIGDGAHAFDITLPAGATPERISVVARSATSKGELVLKPPSPDDRAAAAVLAPMQPVFDRLDLIVAAQRKLQLIQKENADGLKDAAQKLDAMADQEAQVAEALNYVRSGQSDLTSRIDQMEIFLTRFDSSLAGFDKRLKDLSDRGKDELKPQFFALAVMVGLATGFALSLLIHL